MSRWWSFWIGVVCGAGVMAVQMQGVAADWRALARRSADDLERCVNGWETEQAGRTLALAQRDQARAVAATRGCQFATPVPAPPMLVDLSVALGQQ